MPLAFIRDFMENDNLKQNINQVTIGNPYSIIDVNTRSEEEINRDLMNTQLDLYCITDDGRSFAVEMKANLNILNYTHLSLSKILRKRKKKMLSTMQ